MPVCGVQVNTLRLSAFRNWLVAESVPPIGPSPKALPARLATPAQYELITNKLF